MFCPTCGTQAVRAASYCASCGSQLPRDLGAGHWATAGGAGSKIGTPASFGPRLGAYLVDCIVLFGGLVIILPLAGAAGMFGSSPGEVRDRLQVLALAASFVYHCVSALTGGTIGMRAVGLAIESDDGSSGLPLGRALLRTIVLYIGSLPFALGWLWMLWDRDRETWHDKASLSGVVVGR